MKKVTLFLDKTLRDSLQTDKKWSVAYGSALTFFAKLIAQATDPRGAIRHTDWSDIPAHDKFICGCHAESNWVRDMFTEGNRIEACLTLRWPAFGVLNLELSAYRSGDKESFRKFSFSFNQEDGSEAGCSGSM